MLQYECKKLCNFFRSIIIIISMSCVLLDVEGATQNTILLLSVGVCIELVGMQLINKMRT